LVSDTLQGESLKILYLKGLHKHIFFSGDGISSCGVGGAVLFLTAEAQWKGFCDCTVFFV
jgi:hypothetical protein